MKQVLLAFQFLTIVPVKVSGSVSEEDIARSAVFFPLVGAFQGLVIAGSAFLLTRLFAADITSGLLILISLICNGGFDLDGLADTADGMAVKSAGDQAEDRAKRLAAMKDSSTGSIGVLALILLILLKFLFIREVLQSFTTDISSALLFLMPVFSKWITLPAMYHGISARKDGLGKIFIEQVGAGTLLLSTAVMTGLFYMAAVFQLSGLSFISRLQFFFLIVLFFYAFSLISVRFFIWRFGGLTGDHFGALTEVSEPLFLMTGVVWLQHFS
jgi:adenosylcobinamide-GDP ribazoletransferase